jgi:protein ImuB
MDLAHARSLIRDARVSAMSFTPVEDEKKLYALARWALRFSPAAAPDPPDGLLIDIEGCQRLYGGEERLVEKVVAAFRRLGFPARIAVAPTFGCARAVARYGDVLPARIPAEGVKAALGPLPLPALRIDRADCEALAEMGIERVGQLLDLPRKELAARFGNELLAAIDRVLGRAPEPIERITAETSFEAAHDFDGSVTAIETIQVVVHKLLARLVDELGKLQQGIRLLSVELRRMQLEPMRVSLELTYPSGNFDHLWPLIRSKLERANLGYGVEEVLVRAIQTGRIVERQLTLWPDDSFEGRDIHSTSFSELVDRLMSRLGKTAVAKMEPVQTLAPERSFRPIPPYRTRAPSAPPIYPASRPSHLLDIPEPLRVIALVPEGPPAWLRWGNEAHDVVASVGPERIAPPWWENEPTRTRDYFAVQDELGRWLWVFRDRELGVWFVHGEWA